MSSMPSPACSQGGGTGEPDGGGAVQLGSLGDEPVVVAVRSGEGEDPALLGNAGGAGRRHRAHDVGRALVDLHVGRAELGVGERHHAVAGPGRDDLLGRAGGADPRVRVAGRHLAEAGPQGADAGRGAPAASSRWPHAARSRTGGRRAPGGRRRAASRARWLPASRRRRGWRAACPRAGLAHSSQGRAGSRRARARAYIASAPVTSTTSRSPRLMARQASCMRAWGLLPPMDETMSSAGSSPSAKPRRAATRRAGFGTVPAQRRHDPDAVGAPDEGAPGRGRPARPGRRRSPPPPRAAPPP